MPKFTEAEINEAVLRDYNELVGKVVLLNEVDGYDAHDTSVTVTCDPPAIARICRYSDKSVADCVTRWMDDVNCDPQYAIEILEPHPAFVGMRPSWIYGTSRSTDGTTSKGDFVLADTEMQEKYKDAPALSSDEVGACAPQEDQTSTFVMR